MRDDDLDKWRADVRKELVPKISESAFVITLAPNEIDPKIALETGYAVLLNKPIIVVVEPGRTLLPGLRRIATEVIELTESTTTKAGEDELADELFRRLPGIEGFSVREEKP